MGQYVPIFRLTSPLKIKVLHSHLSLQVCDEREERCSSLQWQIQSKTRLHCCGDH